MTQRRIDAAAVSTLVPVLAVVPVWLLAMAVWWFPFRRSAGYAEVCILYAALVVVMFLKPIQQVLVAPLLGARRPTRQERVVLDTAWRSVLQANRLDRRRYALAVLPTEELNAFASGGHLVVVSSYAIAALPRDELTGVLAHELSHHLGSHTIGLTVAQWLSLPAAALAHIGFLLQAVATAATQTFARRSAVFTAVGQFVGGLLNAVAWVFLSGLLLHRTLDNIVGRHAELEADRRAVAMGFGRPLASALRRVASERGEFRPRSRRERMYATHPPVRTRLALIDAELRHLRQRRAQ